MKTLPFLLVIGAWAVFGMAARAQMSTFPTPPPLPSQQDQASDDATNTPSSTAPTPAASDTADGGKNSSAPAPASPRVTAATLTSMSALDDKVSLEPGDTISFRVIEDRDKAVQLVVTDTGEVNFPYINRVKVEGKTCHQVAVEVKKLLEVDYYKQATVIVGLDLIIGQDNTKPKEMAWVMGEVRQVGPLELLKAQPMTVSQMIMRAGGFGDFADQRKVKLIHRLPGGSEEPSEVNDDKDFQVVDVKSVFDGKSAADPVVKPGDYIIVPKKFVNFGG
jgi:polysaccharide export outer membrane protein